MAGTTDADNEPVSKLMNVFTKQKKEKKKQRKEKTRKRKTIQFHSISSLGTNVRDSNSIMLLFRFVEMRTQEFRIDPSMLKCSARADAAVICTGSLSLLCDLY